MSEIDFSTYARISIYVAYQITKLRFQGEIAALAQFKRRTAPHNPLGTWGVETMEEPGFYCIWYIR